jgi:plasmid rolling circle replication initiator protein Rep
MADAATDWRDLFDADREEPVWLPRAYKLGSLAVAEGLDHLGGRYSNLAERMRQCGDFLEFDCYRIGDSEDVERRLVRCSWCRVRLCFLCERARSRKRHIQVCEILDGWLVKRPNDHALLLTLTVQSVGDGELLDAIDQLMISLRRLTRTARFKRAVLAWYRTIEVTRNAETGLWHPHMHLLLIAPRGYFRRSASLYLDQKEWMALWRKCARLDYDPIVDVRAVAGVGGGPLDEGGRKSLAEFTKYCTKPSDLVQFGDDGGPLPVDPQVLKTLYDAPHGRRLVGMSGRLRDLARELGHVDVENEKADLSFAETIPEGAVYLGRESYHWHTSTRDYVRTRCATWLSTSQEVQMPP